MLFRSPYATTQFQQVDVGTNIDLQPHVNGTEDVSMHVKVEVSDVVQTENIAGVQQPVIGQKVNEADIRMKDGEVSVLGGLSDDENNNSISGIPGVTNIPVLGYLFGTKARTHNKDEILIALIPHIVRAPDMSAMGEQGVLAGTERMSHVQRKPDGTTPPPLPGPNVPANVPAPPLSSAPSARPQPQANMPIGRTPSQP